MSDIANILEKNRQRETDLLAKAKLYELKVDADDLDLSLLEQQIIEQEDLIADLVAEARFCSISYSYQTLREELESQIQQAYRAELLHRNQLHRDYLTSRQILT